MERASSNLATKTRLVMTFETDDAGKKVSLSIDNPKEAITEAEIKSAMATVVASNIFDISGYVITKSVEAKIVTTDTTEFDLA